MPWSARARQRADALLVRLCSVAQAVTWFLFALLIWRLTMPLLVRTRAPITLSLVVGLAALFLDLGVNYQNVCAFYPYFVVGKRLPRSLWRTHLSRPSLRLPFAATFLVAAAAVLLYSAYGGARFQRTFGGLAFTYACFNGAPPEQRATECATFSELLRRARGEFGPTSTAAQCPLSILPRC
jgi:hypothetical protein